MLFVVIQLIPWTVLTFLVLRSYLRDRSIEKKHMLWVMSGMMLGFCMSLLGPLIREVLYVSSIMVLKFFDIFHLFALYAIFLLLTDFKKQRRRLVHVMSLLFVLAGIVILVDPTSTMVEGGILTAAYDRGVFSSGVMLSAMVMWGYVAYVFYRHSSQEGRPHLRRSTLYFSIACGFAVLSYASAVIVYVILKIEAGMMLARTLPIVAGFFMYLGARTPNLLSSLHQIVEQHHHLGEERKRLQHLSASTSILGEIGDPERLLTSVIENARKQAGARAVALVRWHERKRTARIEYVSLYESMAGESAFRRFGIDFRDLELRPVKSGPYTEMILHNEPVLMDSLFEVLNRQVPRSRCDKIQRLLQFNRFVHHPLFIDRRYKGTLTFAFADDDFDRNLLRVYANQCGEILRLMDILQTTQQHSKDLESTNQLMRTLHQSKLNHAFLLTDTLSTICENLWERLPSDFVGVWQRQENRCRLICCKTGGADNGYTGVSYECGGSFPEALFLRDFEFSVSFDTPMLDAEGRVVGYLNVAVRTYRTLTSREQEVLKFFAGWTAVEMERDLQTQKLQASEEKYRMLFENALEGIYQISPQGRFIMANPALVKMLGYRDADELFQVDVNHDLFVDQHDLASMLQDIEQHGQVAGRLTHLRRKDDREVVVLASARAITDDKGHTLSYEGVFQDITRRKALEQQLLRAQKMKSIGTLASGVAHDFNNSLSAILPMAELIRLKYQNPDVVKKCIDVIIDAARHSSKLAGQLLTLSKDQKLAKTVVDVHQTVHAVVDLLEKTLPPEITIQVTLADDLPAIAADATQIEQMLINLILNARDAYEQTRAQPAKQKSIVIATSRATPPAHLVVSKKLAADEVGGWIRLAVSDNGCGMDEQTVELIFEPFFSTKKGRQGTGMGLAMVYAIVQNHGGLIDVSSRRDHGSRFDIYLPSCSRRKKRATEIAPGIRKGRGHLLVVDDEEKVLDSLTQILESLGYHCTPVDNGKTAVAVYDPQLHDAVILDVSMPGLDGVQTFQQLKKRAADVRVMLISGFAKGDTIEQALDGGVQAFIRKPFSLAQISAAVYNLVHSNGQEVEVQS